ncbi:nucleosidase [Nocardioides jishulii]|uniref:Nucleosidase n=1 Tax=Nocardioides jishulii TaxID=2575440 RepID=A0A4V6X619_9ACTN|nr:nucleosidase [Nocardioides jishulii]QCX27526.1 nucleosidase [Nocardioides jishulii]TKI62333.1 nucleosidase [Nocardioides jishulii]
MPSSPPRVLVVSATEAEARYVPDGVPVVITGIGKTAAAARTARALAAFEDVEELVVVNIGTAGALRDDVAGLHVVGEVLNHEISAAALVTLGYDPEHRLLLGEDEAVLASGDVFVADATMRSRLAETAHLVDMEGYAVAWTAREFGREAILVKHVSDAADDSAWDWPTVVDRSARVLGEWLEEYLGR